MELVTLVGMSGATLTTVAFLPQAIKVIKTRSTRDLSLGMSVLFVVGVACWLVYGVLLSELPIIIGNAVTFVLATLILGYKIKYG